MLLLNLESTTHTLIQDDVIYSNRCSIATNNVDESASSLLRHPEPEELPSEYPSIHCIMVFAITLFAVQGQGVYT